MLELLQEKNNQRIVFIKTGVFYIATGKDAIFLNKVLKLKCTCFSENVCKVGIPETSLPKYLERLDRLDVSYIVYHFNNEKEIDKQLTYEKLMIAHKLSRKGKGYRKDVILFNLTRLYILRNIYRESISIKEIYSFLI